MWNAAGEVDDFLAAADLAEGVGDDLAVLAGDDLRELALAGVEQLAEGEEYLGALGQGGVTPGREGRGGGVDHRAGVGDAAEGDLAGDLTRGGVGDRCGLGARSGEGLVVQPMADGGHVGSHFLYLETKSVMVAS